MLLSFADVLRLLADHEGNFLMLDENIVSVCATDWSPILINGTVVYVAADIFDDLLRWDYIVEDISQVRIGLSVFRLTEIGREEAER
ncbi:hypothetical protein [Methylocella sp. CPCC 101449]|jgi:hypothetical protein|uniref:hypothetical protein n=1 Tax=Methylocella sp. CPCC 101449 TaxID=2987531 RepID=UPI0009660F76|nr:hypothetical protein [Methylocella sp. CPCC 101449]MBN9084292.1 hypothetical protein [Hyphomicrobiales bacterium]MDT2023006.1 hypothetical protein [Methylocella sp. CPCC 101449]OJY02262.1 MAG: hypothetical protein BGP04_13230 [Rhizobiales bacterium 62-17]HEV2570345.1 hypothetical protein [Beijerinckiaceae bacterium]